MRGEEESGRVKEEEELKQDKLIKERAAVWQMMHGAGSIDLPPYEEGVWAGRCMEKRVREKYSGATALMERPEPPACWQMTCHEEKEKRRAGD